MAMGVDEGREKDGESFTFSYPDWIGWVGFGMGLD